MFIPPALSAYTTNLTRSGSIAGYSLAGILIVALAVIGLLALFHRA